MKKFISFLLLVFIFNIEVNAASLCSYQEQGELNSKAANVKVSYEIVEEKKEFPDGVVTYKNFNISILNVTEEFYAIVRNDITNEEVTYTYSDAKDGIISFTWDYAETVTNFNIQIYSSNNTKCPDEKYKTLYLTTPRYNEYYKLSACTGLEEHKYCQEYVTFNNVDLDKFLTEIESYKNETDPDNPEDPNEPVSFIDKILDFINDNKWYIIGGIIILSVIIISIVIIHRNKTKKQRELGL